MSEKRKPKIGIAFGGGGIRGMAHLGVIEALDSRGIKADMVAGTSIGSAMAALYATGHKGQFLSKMFSQMDLKSIMPVRPSMSGLIDGKNYANFIGILTKHKNIEGADIPLRIVATDLISWEKVVFDQGSIAKAVQASSAIPAAFLPVEIGDRLLVDGCLLDNCPDDVVRGMGADIVISINLDYRANLRPNNVIEVVQRSLDIISSSGQEIEHSDFILSPFHKYVPSLALDQTEYCLQMGREEAALQIDAIEEFINNWQPPAK